MQAVHSVHAFLKNHNIHLDRIAHYGLRAFPVLVSIGIAKTTADVFARTCFADTATAKRIIDNAPSILPGFITNPLFNSLSEGCGNNAATLIALALTSVASAYTVKKAFATHPKTATPVKQKESPKAKEQVASKESPNAKSGTPASPLSPTALYNLFAEVTSNLVSKSTDSPKPTGDVTPKARRVRSKAGTPTPRLTPNMHSMRLRTPKTPKTPSSPKSVSG